MWPDSSRRSSRPVQGDWEGQPEIGRHDTVFRYSFSSENWQTILISFCSAIGLPELGTLSVAIECESWIFALHAHVHMVIARHAGDGLGNPNQSLTVAAWPDVVVRIENEQADITAAQQLPDRRCRRCIERRSID